MFEGRVVGAELKREMYPPIYVSIGNMISLKDSINAVLKTLYKDILPKPLQLAHIETRKMLMQTRVGRLSKK